MRLRLALGQNMLEYALPGGVIASGAIALMPALPSTISVAYQTWGGRNGLWIPLNPTS